MRKCAVIGVLAAVVQAALVSMAQPFAGADTFEGGRNAELWEDDTSAGLASLVQADGHVYQTVSTPAGASDDIGLRFWKGRAPWTNDWAVQVDVRVPVPIAPLDLYENRAQHYGMGIAVTRTDWPAIAGFMSSMVVARHATASSSTHNFLSEYLNAAAGVYNVENTPAGSPLATVRIRWEAATQTLYSEYDSNGPKDGYEWSALRTVPGNDWGMGETNTFSIFITGTSFGLTLSEANELYLDNFVATVGEAPASIEVGIRRAFELFWTAPPGTVQQLQASEDGQTWTDLGDSFISTGLPVSLFDTNTAAPVRFYRIVAE